MDRAIACLMTVVAAAGMTAYADGLEKPALQIATLSTPAGKAKDPAPPEGNAQESRETEA